jgi:hypothetical protein
MQPGHRLREHLLRQILSPMMIPRPPPHKPIHLRVMTAKRTLGNIVHTRLLEQPPRK